MRDHTTTSYLPMLDRVFPLLRRAQNECDAYVLLCKRMEWGSVDTSKKQTAVVNNIRAAVLAAANVLNLVPDERDRLARQLRIVRTENDGLRETVARLREQVQQLQAANLKLVERDTL